MTSHSHEIRYYQLSPHPEHRRTRLRSITGQRGHFLHPWYFVHFTLHVYVGHVPGRFVSAPWCSLQFLLGDAVVGSRDPEMKRCLELWHAFVEP